MAQHCDEINNIWCKNDGKIDPEIKILKLDLARWRLTSRQKSHGSYEKKLRVFSLLGTTFAIRVDNRTKV
jgi:hypothetical protein